MIEIEYIAVRPYRLGRCVSHQCLDVGALVAHRCRRCAHWLHSRAQYCDLFRDPHSRRLGHPFNGSFDIHVLNDRPVGGMSPEIAQICRWHDSGRDELLVCGPHHHQRDLPVARRWRCIGIYVLHRNRRRLMLRARRVLIGNLLLEGLTIHHPGLEDVGPYLEEIILEIAGQQHDIVCDTPHLPLKLLPNPRAEATAHMLVLRTHAIPSGFVYAFNVNKCHVRATSYARTEYSLICQQSIYPAS